MEGATIKIKLFINYTNTLSNGTYKNFQLNY